MAAQRGADDSPQRAGDSAVRQLGVRRADGQLAALWHGVAGVHRQVQQYLVQHAAVGAHRQAGGVQVQLELSAGNTEGLRIQLTGPDGTVAQWEGGPTGLSAEPIYRSPAQAGAAIHGAWRLNIYRVAGAPAVNLISWSLYTLGKHHGGRGQAKFWWGVYFDPAHQYAAPRDIEGTLDRITQSYEHSYRIYSLTSSPGTSNHRAGLFIPGA